MRDRACAVASVAHDQIMHDAAAMCQAPVAVRRKDGGWPMLADNDATKKQMASARGEIMAMQQVAIASAAQLQGQIDDVN